MELVPNEIIRPMFILWVLNSRHKLRHCYFAVKIVSEAHFLFQDFKSNIGKLSESKRTICVVEIFIMHRGKMILTQLPVYCMLYTKQTNKIQYKNQEEKWIFSFIDPFSYSLVLNVLILPRRITYFTSEVKCSMDEQGYARIVHYDDDDKVEHSSA